MAGGLRFGRVSWHLEPRGQRAAARGVDVEYVVADATSPTGFEGRFDTVLDSTLYHCPTER
ncbi:class I SAM-dependent methyltransferase [Nocardia sp. NBC_00416]|uniref:class I SAM-dependent methyltransferase n=1 Tax=Nocardia sp. NBC_00416 TaxID=2975991 RepID=UPI002E1BEA2A